MRVFDEKRIEKDWADYKRTKIIHDATRKSENMKVSWLTGSMVGLGESPEAGREETP